MSSAGLSQIARNSASPSLVMDGTPGTLVAASTSIPEVNMNPTRREVIAATLAASISTNYASTREESKLTLAAFDAEVTIPLGHPCMGGGITPAKEIVDPLFAYGFVLSGVGKPVVFLALDWCEIRNGAYDHFREAVAK